MSIYFFNNGTKEENTLYCPKLSFFLFRSVNRKREERRKTDGHIMTIENLHLVILKEQKKFRKRNKCSRCIGI